MIYRYIVIWCQMSTPDISFRIPPNFTTKAILFIVSMMCRVKLMWLQKSKAGVDEKLL